jgi:RNA polymerase sigma factor (sigma-70 family)
MEGRDLTTELESLLTTSRRALVATLSGRIPRRLRGIITAEDVAQEAALEALRSIGDFRPGDGDSMRRWVWRIARHRLCDLIKSNGRLKRSAGAPDVALPEDVAAVETRAGGAAEGHETYAALQRALETLPRTYRQAIHLRYTERLSVAAAAARLGRTPAALTMLCNRGLKRLRRELEITVSPVSA